jgi:thiol-disulfide isomerase/thioredoxin
MRISRQEAIHNHDLKLTNTNFDSETSSGLVLVDFWAPRCQTCRRIGPIISKVASAVHGKAKVRQARGQGQARGQSVGQGLRRSRLAVGR